MFALTLGIHWALKYLFLHFFFNGLVNWEFVVDVH